MEYIIDYNFWSFVFGNTVNIIVFDVLPYIIVFWIGGRVGRADGIRIGRNMINK
jgi:hypothetical protein